MRSPPESTFRSLLLITHFDTNEPRLPWARFTPAVLPSSWFITTVNVPSPLSNAPRPSGMPTIRYVPTVSPTETIDSVSTAATDGNTYDDCVVVGPDDCADRTNPLMLTAASALAH